MTKIAVRRSMKQRVNIMAKRFVLGKESVLAFHTDITTIVVQNLGYSNNACLLVNWPFGIVHNTIDNLHNMIDFQFRFGSFATCEKIIPIIVG